MSMSALGRESEALTIIRESYWTIEDSFTRIIKEYMCCMENGELIADLLCRTEPHMFRESIFIRSHPCVRQFYERMPPVVRIYRGYYNDLGNDKSVNGFSWATCANIAQPFGERMLVADVKKEFIHAVLPHNETEIFISPLLRKHNESKTN